MDLILKGFVTGFILSIMVGPVFFVLLETSIRKGVKAAIAMDIGVLLSDIIYIIIAFVFYQQVADLQKGHDNSLLRLIGGILFCVYGAYNYFKKVKETHISEEFEKITTTAGYIWLAVKGLILNLMNPLVVFYWFSVMTLASEDVEAEDGNSKMILYLLIILITFFSIDLLKILGAKRLRPLVTSKVLKALNRFIGIIFALFGIILIAQGIVGLVTK